MRPTPVEPRTVWCEPIEQRPHHDRRVLLAPGLADRHRPHCGVEPPDELVVHRGVRDDRAE
jgi:hypothetical protein